MMNTPVISAVSFADSNPQAAWGANAMNASTLSQPISFSQVVSNGLEGVNQDLLSAQVDLQRLATGDVQNLHQIMINMEEHRINFQLFMQVRNRLLEAYQDIMKMQV